MGTLDKLAKGKKPSTGSKKKSHPIASVTDAVQKAVDDIITTKAEIKSLTSQLGEQESLVIGHVAPQQDKDALAGNHHKSYTVDGNAGSLTYTTSDKFSIPQDEDSQAALKKLLGKKYDDFFETKRTVSLNKKVHENDDLIDKIIAAIEKAGIDISEALDVTDVVVKKEGLDKKQFELGEQKLAIFRTMVTQAKAALK